MFNAGGDTSNALSIATHFPMIKLTHWFDYSKVHPCLRLLTIRQAMLTATTMSTCQGVAFSCMRKGTACHAADNTLENPHQKPLAGH